ncbi:MAG: lipopolysaccharide biosynthesis protein [Elusimicrobiota bacterium]
MSASILRRFSATLAANLVGAAVAFAASIVLARGLGAETYGDFNFLLASFAAINAWLDLGTSTAVFTFLSKGKDSRRHFRAYSFWLGLRFAVVALAVGLLLPSGWIDRIWLGHGRGLVLLAFAGFFASVPVRAFLIQAAESVRRTLFIQSAVAAVSVAHLALVLTLLVSGRLSVPNLLLLLVAEYAALAVYFGLRFDWSLLSAAGSERPWKEFFGQYATYCSPLVLYSFIGFVYEFADRWLLQYFGGSAQQGFFSLTHKFAMLGVLATTSLLNIFWKEIAEAERKGDKERVRSLYRRSSRALFFIAAAVGCFLIPHSRTLLIRLVGPEYEAAWPALSLMFVFPMFQTLGQLNGTFFFATEDTKTHVLFSSAAMVLSLPVTYFLLAEPSAAVPGLGLGATGLAARWSFWTMFTVSAQSWIVCRRQRASTDIIHPFLVLALLLALGAASKALAAALCGLAPVAGADLWAFALSAPLYAAGAIALVLLLPEHVGTERAQLARILPWRPESL